jgi:hypothetical protein
MMGRSNVDWLSSRYNTASTTLLILSTAFLSGCFVTNGQLASTNAVTIQNTLPSTARAVRIIFQTGTSGSFNVPSNAGTPVGVGNGLQALRLFDTQGNTIATTGTTDPNWPTWLQSFEIGISGASNTAAPNPNCARFPEGTSEASAACTFGSNSSTCGSSANFRISEVDCGVSPPATGQGNAQDGIYFRAIFNRNTAYLGPTENILAVIEYAASAYNGAPSNPTTCFSSSSGTGFAPEQCADFSWKVFLKHYPTEATQPFMMMIPPTPYYVYGNSTNTSGASTVTKQFFVPLASDQNLTEVQISRITSNLVSGWSGWTASNTYANYLLACDPGTLRTSTGADTPLCAGLVVSSITFYRI